MSRHWAVALVCVLALLASVALYRAFQPALDRPKREEGRGLIEPACVGGDVAEITTIALRLLSGAPGDTGAEDEALAWLELAANEGSRDAMYELGRLLLRSDRRVEVVRGVGLIRRAALAGHPLAAKYIAGAVVRENADAAERWYGLAAEGGDAESMVQYAYLLRRGCGPNDYLAPAEVWLRRAVGAGLPEANSALSGWIERGWAKENRVPDLR